MVGDQKASCHALSSATYVWPPATHWIGPPVRDRDVGAECGVGSEPFEPGLDHRRHAVPEDITSAPGSGHFRAVHSMLPGERSQNAHETQSTKSAIPRLKIRPHRNPRSRSSLLH